MDGYSRGDGAQTLAVVSLGERTRRDGLTGCWAGDVGSQVGVGEQVMVVAGCGM